MDLVHGLDDIQPMNINSIIIDPAIINLCGCYTFPMGYKKTGEPPGPKPTFSRALGKGINGKYRFPEPIHDLLKEAEVKGLLNRMALKPDFKAKILAQVPEEDPPEP